LTLIPFDAPGTLQAENTVESIFWNHDHWYKVASFQNFGQPLVRNKFIQVLGFKAGSSSVLRYE
jgi:hypothetical protein